MQVDGQYRKIDFEIKEYTPDRREHKNPDKDNIGKRKKTGKRRNPKGSGELPAAAPVSPERWAEIMKAAEAMKAAEGGEEDA
jgi:hypothetical protein